MANIKQQIKRNKTNEKRRLRNQSFKSACKTSYKAVEIAVANGNKEEATKALEKAYQKYDKAQSKGIYHRNTVARHKSTLANLVNTLLK